MAAVNEMGQSDWLQADGEVLAKDPWGTYGSLSLYRGFCLTLSHLQKHFDVSAADSPIVEAFIPIYRRQHLKIL